MNIPGFSAEAALGSRQRVLPMCPVCGEGETQYYEWQCKDNRWQQVRVGLRAYGLCDAPGTMIFGRETNCYVTDRAVGGGGNQDCFEASCPPPPSRSCGPRSETHLPLGGTAPVSQGPF
jgi:hypothetical protein